MAMTWTDDQRRVIDARKQNILVSAAAGSGKTAVLVERILALVTDPERPVDIDELLIVTFTRAAADEMRERIRKALEEARKQKPFDRHLLRQLTLIHNASITTIDSFCMQVVKNHFQEVDLDPAFRVGEEGELKLLMQDVLEDLLEEAYEEGNQEFLDFADCYASGNTDKTLEKLILRLYEFAQSYPWPEKWLHGCQEESESWLEELVKSIRASIKTYVNQAEMALDLCISPEGPYMYEPAVRSDLEQLKAMEEAGSFEQLGALIAKYQFVRLSPKKDAAVSETKKESVKGIRENYKKSLEDLKKKFFFQGGDALHSSMEQTKGAVKQLVLLTSRFQERYRNKKRDRNLVDFSDLEHYALEIFLKEENGQQVRTDTARAYAGKYKEIFIDEYQDSNLVQEILLNSISREADGEHNLFMVGDVKQSIYSFRLARPELFLGKYHRYKEGEEGCQRIDLKQNFRSRNEVLTCVNFLFEQIMQDDLGAVAYDETAALYPGASYPEKEGCQELLLLENSSDESEDAMVGRELEAKMCADRIRRIMQEEQVTDKESGCLRSVRYSDIVILLRAMDGWADIFQEVLEQEGIPCRTTLRSGYFTSYEIQTMLNMLRIIDNPKQDIPLAAVLKSVIGGFSDQELAQIRSEHKDRNFYEAFEIYRFQGSKEVLRQKVEAFYGRLKHFRQMVSYTPIHELIWTILDETGFEAYVTAMPGGRVRQANLAMLADKAMAFERTSYKGVFHFVRYIDRMIRYQVDYGEADASGERPDAVEIQSIHKSKGLEYPVVFLAGMGKKFNEMDARSAVVLHMDYGIGLDYVDSVLRVRTTTLKKRAIQRCLHQEMLGEELRVLYVAMTRAKEKLIMTGTVKSLEKKLQTWYPETGNHTPFLSYEARLKAGSYLDFVMPALLRNRCSAQLLDDFGLTVPRGHSLYEKDAAIQLKVLTAEDLVWEKTGQEIKRQVQLDAWAQELKEQVENIQEKGSQRINVREGDVREFDVGEVYPWTVYENLPVKLSVSELKKQQNKIADEDAASLYEEEPVIPLVPKFIEQTQEVAGSVRGDAYHRLMELMDFGVERANGYSAADGSAQSAADAIDAEVQHHINAGRYSVKEYELVNPQDIADMLASSLGERMAAAAKEGNLFREQPFVIGIPAGEVREEFADSGEQILIQGIIDAFFYENNEIVLLDYKTDRLYTEKAFIEHYQVQLQYYQKALEQITGKKVKEIFIYSFTLGKAIRL